MCLAVCARRDDGQYVAQEQVLAEVVAIVSLVREQGFEQRVKW